MKKFIKENWFKIGLLIILVISVAGSFYWFEIRPSEIRKSCLAEIKLKAITINIDRPDLKGDAILQQEQRDYKTCLIVRGLSD